MNKIYFMVIKTATILAISVILHIQVAKGDILGTGFTYQGELTTSGSPANGQFDFEFALFDDLIGGVETGALLVLEDIEVTNGIFSVELDFGIGPFNGDQTWLEITVREGSSNGGFTSLLPRQKLTAAPYALHAEMVAADAIGANELSSNSVGSSEITSNAVGTSEIISSQVQQRVTGTCPVGDFTTAINQDGSMTCSADQTGIDGAAAVAAVLAADGSGSGLDADLLDGQDSSQLIENSRVGTAIDSLPFTISQAGRYYFTTNLSYSAISGAAINVNTDDVTIDMNGFRLTGPGQTGNTTDGIAILSGRNGIRIMNGTIKSFGSRGIISSNSFADGNIIKQMRVAFVGDEGIRLNGKGNLIEDCVIDNSNGSSAISFGAGIIRNTTVLDAANVGIQAITAIIVDSIVTNAGSIGIANSSGLSERVIVN